MTPEEKAAYDAETERQRKENEKKRAAREAAKAATAATPTPAPEPTPAAKPPAPVAATPAPAKPKPPPSATKPLHLCTEDEDPTSGCIPDSFLLTQRKKWEKEYEAEHACTVVFDPHEEPPDERLRLGIFTSIAVFFVSFFLYRFDARRKEKSQ